MNINRLALFTLYLSSAHGKCPFSNKASNTGVDEFPNDTHHQSLREQAEVHERRVDIITEAKQRNLQRGSQCLTSAIYQGLLEDIKRIGDTFSRNNGAQGHFYGVSTHKIHISSLSTIILLTPRRFCHQLGHCSPCSP